MLKLKLIITMYSEKDISLLCKTEKSNYLHIFIKINLLKGIFIFETFHNMSFMIFEAIFSQ